MKKTDKSAAPCPPFVPPYFFLLLLSSLVLDSPCPSIVCTSLRLSLRAKPSLHQVHEINQRILNERILPSFFRENNLLFVMYLTNKHVYIKKTYFREKKIRIRRFKIRCLISLEHVTRVVEAFALLRQTRRMDGRERGEPIGEH